MIYLICDDLKSSLIKITRSHILKLLNVLITSHQTECQKVCDEFEKIKAKALKRPETTEELNEIARFMEIAKSTGLTLLEKKVKELLNAILYLLEVHIFSKEYIDLNTCTLKWLTDIHPIFEKNEEVKTYKFIILNIYKYLYLLYNFR